MDIPEFSGFGCASWFGQLDFVAPKKEAYFFGIPHLDGMLRLLCRMGFLVPEHHIQATTHTSVVDAADICLGWWS